MINDKTRMSISFYLKLAIPISVQSMLFSSASLLDQIMLGQIDESALVAVNIIAKIMDIHNYFLIAVSGCLSIIMSQYQGGNHSSDIEGYVREAKKICYFFIIFLCILAIVFSQNVLRLFINDTDIIKMADLYWKLMVLTLLPGTLISLYSALLRCIGKVNIPLVISILSILCNLILNYILIFGKFGLPSFGVFGAAIGTIVAKIIEAILIVYFSYKNNIYKMFKYIHLAKKEKNNFYSTMLPLFATNISFVFATTIYTAFYSNLGTNEMAIYSVIIPIQGLIISFFSGNCTATTIVIGRDLGSKNTELAYKKAKQILIINLLFSSIVCVCTRFLFRDYLNLFKITSVSVGIGINFVNIILFFVPIKVMNMILVQGILSSGGETKFLFKLSLVGMWLIGIPLGYISSVVMKCPISYVYVFITLEEVVRVFIGIAKLKTKTWMKIIE